MPPKSLNEKIAEIPGKGGWWKSGSEKDFLHAATQLVEKGFSEDEAVSFLSWLYYAVADCYGD